MPSQASHTSLAEQLLADLRSLHQRILKRSLFASSLLFGAVILAGTTLLVLAEQSFYLPAWAKITIWTGIFLTAGGITKWQNKNRPSLDFTRFYRDFCRKHDIIEIENALDLHLGREKQSSILFELAVQRNLERYRKKEWEKKLNQHIQSHPLHRKFLSGGAFFIAALIFAGLTSIPNPDALQRSLTLWNSAERPNPYDFVISPGDTTLEHGSTFIPGIEFTGRRAAEQVTFAVKTGIEDEFRFRPMSRSENNLFTGRAMELTSDASYYIRMDNFQSQTYSVDVQLRPRFESLTVLVQPPAYTGLSRTEHTYPFANLRAYGGSGITLWGKANKPVDSLHLYRGGEREEPVQSEDDPLLFETTFTLEQTDTLRFTMSDRDSLMNRNPFQFVLNLRPDEYPTVSILEPEEQTFQIHEPELLNIFYQAADDFGLTSASLVWELTRAFTTEPVEGTRALDTPSVGPAEQIGWDLEELDLRPRDRLRFRINVRDNDAWSGYKSSTSQWFTLEVPSMSAWFEEVDEKERNVQDALDEVSEKTREMQEEYEQFRERMRENPEPGWEEDQMLEDVDRQQEEIEESINRVKEQFQEVRREMENSSSVSEETRRSYRELQDLIDELDNPELRRALEEMRKSMQSLNPEDLQEAMENFEFNEQVYQERLKRTLELFKTLKMNSDLDKLARQYEELAGRMDEVVSEEEQPPGEELDQQQGVREDTDHIERQLENLDNRPPERSRERLENLKEESLNELKGIQQELDELIEEAAKRAQASGTGSDESEAGGDERGREAESESPQQGSELSGGQDGNSPSNDSESGESMPDQQIRERQENVRDRLQARAETMRQSRQQMSGQQIQVNLLALKKSLYTLLELSESQEELTLEAGQTDSRSQRYVELAQRQNNIQNQFSQVSDSLFQIASEIPHLSNSINRKKNEVEQTLQRAREQMAEREQRTSVVTSRESLGGINDLASMIASVIDQLMNQQNGGGGGAMTLQQMIEQMQNMSGNQQMLNQQLQELINDLQGERLTRDQTERLEQITRQQNEIRKQLEELQRSGALQQGDRTLSEMQRMMEEMEDAINDMRGGVTDPMMIERQQNIFSRMLQAEESLQKRDQEEDEYEGRSPDEFERSVPPDITLEELRQEIRSRLQDPDFTRFSDEYQRLIERYFELLDRYEESPLP